MDYLNIGLKWSDSEWMCVYEQLEADVWDADGPLRQEGRFSHLGTDSLFQIPH